VIEQFVTLGVWDSIMGALSTMMQPLYWAISGILVASYHLWGVILALPTGAAWSLAIVSLTVVVRMALIPLFVKQINSSRNMQLLSPKLKELNEKYSHDREKLGQETMKLYKDEGVNPLASCLPLFLQMPIFIGLFNVLNGVSNGAAVGEFFVRDPNLVTSLRNASIFGASLAGKFMPMTNGFGPNQVLAGLLVIGLVVTLFFTQLHMMRKNMPPEALTGPMAQQQKTMLYILPLSYLFFGISIPIGVMLYWFASNLWTLAQQYILIHNNPSPNTPAFIDWQERMRAKGQDPDQIIRDRSAKLRKKKEGPVAGGSATVARQGTSGPTSAPAPAAGSVNGSADAQAPDGKQRVTRQQPTKASRAQRKQVRPKSGGDSTKE